MTIQNYKEQIFSFAFFLMFVLVLFPTNVKSIVIAFFLLIMLAFIITEKLKFDLKYFIVNAAIYLLLLLSLTYSEDLNFSVKKLESMVSLFVFPLIFSFFSKQNGYLLIEKLKISNRFLIYYILSVLLINLVFFSIFWFDEFTFLDTTKHYAYLIDIKLGKYNIHSIYMSMHICVSIIFALIIIMKNINNKINLFLIIAILLQLFFLLVLNKKGPILSLVAILALYIFYKGNSLKRFIFLASLVLLTIIISTNTKSRDQFKELFRISDIEESDVTSTNIRYTIYKNALIAFKKQPFFGYGIGDSKNELVKVYKNNSLLLYEKEYNTHNQYLSFLLSVGVFGFLLISIAFFYILQKGLKQSNFLFLSIFLFYLIEMFSENILERENGVIFYSFFVCLFQILKTEDNTL